MQVSLNFDKVTVRPAGKVSLSVTADPGSRVSVLAVDKSVLLLKSGNDITSDQVSCACLYGFLFLAQQISISVLIFLYSINLFSKCWFC